MTKPAMLSSLRLRNYPRRTPHDRLDRLEQAQEMSQETSNNSQNVKKGKVPSGDISSIFAKSKKSAVIMCVIALLAICTVSGLTNIAPHFVTGNTKNFIEHPENLSNPNIVVLLGSMLLLALALGIGCGSFFIYRFADESHFGIQGAIGWAILGVAWALLVQAQHWLFPLLDSYRVVMVLLDGVIFVVLYSLVFKIVVHKRRI